MSSSEIAASSIVLRHPGLSYWYLAFRIWRTLTLTLRFQLCIVSFKYWVELDMGPYDLSDNIMQSDQGTLKQFEILKKVGEGAFGQVYQVRRRVDN